MVKKITYEDVAKACNELWQEKEKRPSVHAVRAITKGGMGTVHGHWQRWCEERNLLARVSEVVIPQELADSLCAQLAKSQQHGYATAKQKIDEMTEVIGAYQIQEKELEAEVEVLRLSLQCEKDSVFDRVRNLEKELSAKSAISQQSGEMFEKLEAELISTRKSLFDCAQELEKVSLVCHRLGKESDEMKARESKQNDLVSSLQKENIRLEKEVSVMQMDNSNLKSKLDDGQAEIEKLNTENAELSSRISTAMIERIEGLERQLQMHAGGK